MSRQAIPDEMFKTDEQFAREAVASGDIRAIREAGRRFIAREGKTEAKALIAAGWTLILPEGCRDPLPYQWQWRRPGKRPGKPGRKFLSTSQAHNALIKEQSGGQ